MEREIAIAEINKLATVREKLQFYNDNVQSLIQINCRCHTVHVAFGSDEKIFCLCEQCRGKCTKGDFENYRDIRNFETQKIIDYFDSAADYLDKVKLYFELCAGYSNTTRKLYFVPENIENIDIDIFPYLIKEISIIPEDKNQESILKIFINNNLANKRVLVGIRKADYTFEKRVEYITNSLKIRKEKNRRDEAIQAEFEKIKLSNYKDNSTDLQEAYFHKVLTTVENIIQKKHIENYIVIKDIETTVLAEGTIKYENFLNEILAQSNTDFNIESLSVFEENLEQKNSRLLNQHYNAIINTAVFQEIINHTSELYFLKRTNVFADNRNIKLEENDNLRKVVGWLKSFNNHLKWFLQEIVTCTKYVVDWKENQTKYTSNNLSIRISKRLEFFRDLPSSLRQNYDGNNDFLVFQMRQYYLTGFEIMLDFLKSDLLIDFKKSPFFEKLNVVIEDVKDAIDIESLMMSINYSQKSVTVLPQQDNEVAPKQGQKQLDQLDSRLDKWLKENQSKYSNLYIPQIFEDKRDYVIDTHKNYEKRYFKYHIEVCDKILNTVPNNIKILALKSQFQNCITELNKQNPIPSLNIETIIADINNAFFRIENFMKGTISIYESFLFNDAFTLFFNELNKVENINSKNFNIRDSYFNLLYSIDYAYDKSLFKNQEAYKNEFFNRDCNEISYIYFHRTSEFGVCEDLEEDKFEMPSIVNVISELPSTIKPEIINIGFEDKIIQIGEENPYPRIFKNYKAYAVFKNLLEEFGTSKDNLANFSFVYHRMKKDGLIYDDFQKLQFTYFLLDFDIKIDRIKRMEEIGKIPLRESIYSKAK